MNFLELRPRLDNGYGKKNGHCKPLKIINDTWLKVAEELSLNIGEIQAVVLNLLGSADIEKNLD